MAILSIKQFKFFDTYLDELPEILTRTSTSSTSSTFATLNRDGYGGIRYEVRGTDFKYANGDLVSAKISSITGLISDGTTFSKYVEFTGVTLDMAKARAEESYNPFLGTALNYDGSALEPNDNGFGPTINGSDLNDTMRGGVGTDVFRGYLGNDKLYGGDGSDTLVGGGGNDRLYGENGDDFMNGGQAAVYFSGGSGTDTVGYVGETNGLIANLEDPTKNAGVAAGDTYSSVENLVGSFNTNRLTGNDNANTLISYEGRDTLLGGGGHDILMGGEAADRLFGNSGTDTAAYTATVAGGRVTYGSGDGQGVTASLADSSKNTNDAKGDVYSSIENLSGTNHQDKLYGDTKANVLTGLGGNDALYGASGNDTLKGEDGEDRLLGGNGADRLSGGLSADVFVFKALGESTTSVTGRDTILDFTRGDGDKIDLSALDARTGTAGNQAFQFIGNDGFNEIAGELRYSQSNGKTYIQADVNGDGASDFAIQFDLTRTFITTDFLL